MATKITPLHDRVILKRIEDNVNQTAGGLFIPDTAKEKPQEGEVIAAGEGKYKEDLWKDWTGKTVQELGDEWKKMHEDRLQVTNEKEPAAK